MQKNGTNLCCISCLMAFNSFFCPLLSFCCCSVKLHFLVLLRDVKTLIVEMLQAANSHNWSHRVIRTKRYQYPNLLVILSISSTINYFSFARFSLFLQGIQTLICHCQHQDFNWMACLWTSHVLKLGILAECYYDVWRKCRDLFWHILYIFANWSAFVAREAEANHMQRFRITFYLHLLTILWIHPNVQPLNCIIMYMYVPIGLSFINLPSLWPSLGVVVFVGCAGSWITSQSLFGGYPQIEFMSAANKA